MSFLHPRRHARRCARQDPARTLDDADRRLVVLALLAEQPRTGLEVMAALEARIGVGAEPALVYPCLMMLEDLGQVAVTADPSGRRLHALTEAGRAVLAANRRLVDAILADAAGTPPAGLPPAFARALERLQDASRPHRCCRHAGAVR